MKRFFSVKVCIVNTVCKYVCIFAGAYLLHKCVWCLK